MRTLRVRVLSPFASQRGIALITALLIALAVSALAVAATTIGMNDTLIRSTRRSPP